MADPEDRKRPEGISPGGPPRRPPPTIDVKAVEIPLDGAGATATRTGADASPPGPTRWPPRILAFRAPVTLAIIGSACVITGIIAGALSIYSPRSVAHREAAVPGAVVEPIAKPETSLDALPSQAPSPPYPAPLGGEGALENRIAALERAVRDAVAAARAADERSDKIASVFEGTKRSGDEPNLSQLHDHGALEDLANRVATLESQQTALKQKQEGLDRLAEVMTGPDEAARLATVAVALRSAVERGTPFVVELAAARSLGLDEKALASLEPFAATGLPTRDELFRGLSDLLPELRRLTVPPSQDLGYFGRLQASAVKMLHIRPVRDEPGDDPATVMSRIEFKMRQQDIDAMVAELDKLPPPVTEFAQPWRTKALARQQALESARIIATTSLAKLGEPAVRGRSPR